MIRINISKFYELQGDMTETEMANRLQISRSQLWRVKQKHSSVGQEFIAKFKSAYPEESIDEYFFVESVT